MSFTFAVVCCGVTQTLSVFIICTTFTKPAILPAEYKMTTDIITLVSFNWFMIHGCTSLAKNSKGPNTRPKTSQTITLARWPPVLLPIRNRAAHSRIMYGIANQLAKKKKANMFAFA